jgi:hypothetical protein
MDSRFGLAGVEVPSGGRQARWVAVVRAVVAAVLVIPPVVSALGRAAAPAKLPAGPAATRSPRRR